MTVGFSNTIKYQLDVTRYFQLTFISNADAHLQRIVLEAWVGGKQYRVDLTPDQLIQVIWQWSMQSGS